MTGNPKEIGELFTSDSRIRKISFTGSTAVGKHYGIEEYVEVKYVLMGGLDK